VNAHPVTAAKRRSGFTLIEILVVIAIIAILASLLMGAVMMFWNKGPEVTNKNDILQLSTALQKFKSNYGQYPPDMIKLCSNSNLYGNTVLDQQSVSFLSNVMFKNLGAYAGMNWGGRSGATAPVFGNPANPTVDILEGDQCLVFFLGGPPGMGGFSNNPNNPTMAGGERLKFFDFNAGRLQVVSSGATRSAQFPSYIDAYGKMPFIYFSAGKSTGGYVATNSLGVAPYRSGSAFLNPDSFQIISAGLNMQFGAGGTWVPANTPLAGKDDVSNFHDKILGAP
jgi:prepilin-type N-terminal cleavage/methylation domain-containing protein